MSGTRQSANWRQERGKDPLTVRLPDWSEAQGGGDEIGGLGEGESLEAASQRQAVAACRRGDSDRIGNAPLGRLAEAPQRLAPRSRTRIRPSRSRTPPAAFTWT